MSSCVGGKGFPVFFSLSVVCWANIREDQEDVKNVGFLEPSVICAEAALSIAAHGG